MAWWSPRCSARVIAAISAWPILGCDDTDIDLRERHLLGPPLSHTDGTWLATDPAGAAVAAREHVEASAGAILVHFDIDAIDSADLPLANYPPPGHIRVSAGEARAQVSSTQRPSAFQSAGGSHLVPISATLPAPDPGEARLAYSRGSGALAYDAVASGPAGGWPAHRSVYVASPSAFRCAWCAGPCPIRAGADAGGQCRDDRARRSQRIGSSFPGRPIASPGRWAGQHQHRDRAAECHPVRGAILVLAGG